MRPRHFTRIVASAMAFTAALIATAASAQVVSGAGETLQMTLEDAVRRAVENNPDLAIVRLDTEVEAARVGEAQGAFVPEFSTTLGRSSTATPPSNFLLGDRGVDLNDSFSSTGVRQRLPWGAGTWRVSWDTSRTTTNNPLSSFDPSLQSGLQIAFSQPLLRDRKMDPARHQYILAKRNQESSELGLREVVVQTVAAVKLSYWTLKATIAYVAVQQRSLDLAQELVRQNRARVDLGLSPPLDLVQAEAEVAQRREELIRARTAVGDAEDRLRRLIMDPREKSFWQVRLDPIDQPMDDPPPDPDAAVSNALTGRYDIARARKDLDNAATNVAFFDNQRLPDIRLETSYRGSGLGGTQFLRTGGFPGLVTGTLNSGFGDVLNQVLTGDFPTWSVGFTVSYPLGRSYEQASLARAQVERKQAAHRIESLQLQAAEAVRQAARQVRSTAERVDAVRAGATLAEQRLETEERRYQVGLSTSFFVTQAQRDLQQAQVNLLQATLDHQSSLVNYEALQQAPAVTAGETIGLRGTNIVSLPIPVPAPGGVFRQGAGLGFPQ
jgi:outer membrane protein